MSVKHAFGRLVPLTHDEAVERVTAALAGEGFAVPMETDVADRLESKWGLEMPPYRILGACHPQVAHRALDAEPRIGAPLCGNEPVRDGAAGHTIVEVMGPAAVLRHANRLPTSVGEGGHATGQQVRVDAGPAKASRRRGRARHQPGQRIVTGTWLASSPRAGDIAVVNGDSLALRIRRDPMNPRHAGSPARGCESRLDFQPRSE